jgi:hypothetical protein
MKKKEDTHQGCPNRGHCKKDESKCCYLLSTQHCYLDSNDSEEFV